MAYNRRRRAGWGGGPRVGAQPIRESQGVQVGRRAKCAACGRHIELGDTFVRLRLRKRFRLPCATCTQTPRGAKRYHVGCVPLDKQKAMGYVPHGTPQYQASPSNHVPSSHSVPPPPKPPTPEESALAALVALEQAVIVRAKSKGVTPEMQAAFKQFQGIKARVLRPGTPAEGDVATFVAIQKIVKMVFA